MTSPPDDDDRTVVKPGDGFHVGAAAPGATLSGPTYDSQSPEFAHTLPWGTKLGEFELHDLVGEGGFGIVYLAWDYSLDRKVAVKEYMPTSIAARAGSAQVVPRSERHRATFDVGLKSFIKEAKLLASFDHPSLLKVYRFWEANGTAYMAMPYYEGVTLKDAVAALPKPPDEPWLLALLAPLTEALSVIHADHCYHRDIAPDNILLLTGNDRPLLLDFGAARRVIGDMTQSLTVILKPGYAPVEQYGEVPGLRQGPWTDVYALAAVVYWAVTGKTPPPSVARMVRDPLTPLVGRAGSRYSAGFLKAIDNALAVLPERRTQTIDALRLDLGLGALPVASSRNATVASPARAGAHGTSAPALPRSGERRVSVPRSGSSAPKAMLADASMIATDGADELAVAAEAAPYAPAARSSTSTSKAVFSVVGMGAAAAVAASGWLWWVMREPSAEPVGRPAGAATAASAGAGSTPPEATSEPAVTSTSASAPAGVVSEPAPLRVPENIVTAPVEPVRTPVEPRGPRVKPVTTKPQSNPQAQANSAECARILQRMSLGDTHPKLAARLVELGC